MELIEGKKVSYVINSDEGFDEPLVAKRGVGSFFKQVLIHEFFHADIHSANIYVLVGIFIFRDNWIYNKYDTGFSHCIVYFKT